MTSYQERSEINRRLANQAYFDAKLKKVEPQKKDVRIGGMDGQTGRYQVFHADGGFSNNGVRTFDGTPPSDRFVRGQQNPNSNAIALGYRDYVRTEFLNRVEEEEEILEAIAFVNVVIAFTFSGLNTSGQPKSGIFFNGATDIANETFRYIYNENNGSLVSSEGEFDLNIFGTSSFGGSDNNINPLTAVVTQSENQFTVTTVEPLLNLPPISPYVFYEIQFVFPFSDADNPWIEFDEGEFSLTSSPIEFELLFNGSPVGGSFNEVNIIKRVNQNFFIPNYYVVQVVTETNIGAGITVNTFSFRYRRRVTSGDPLPWFQL